MACAECRISAAARPLCDVYGGVLPQVEESLTEGLTDLSADSRGAGVLRGAIDDLRP
jgi:hypothetical protein